MNAMTRILTAWLPWLVLAAGAAGILYGMVGYWVRGYDGPDRAIIILASAWLVWNRRGKLALIPDTPRPRLGMALVALGALAYLPPWFVYSQIGPRPIILWWEAIALFIATVGVILIRSGWNLFTAVRFSMIFPLFALPLPGRIQNPFQQILQAIASSIAAEIIPLFGIPIEMKRGNEIMLPSGGIDVVGACSGLTQVRAILAVSAFIAHIRGFGAGRGLITLLFAVPTLVFINSLRVSASGIIREWTGSAEYIEGIYHELLGLALFVVGLAIVLAFSRLLIKPGDTNAFTFTGEVPQPSRTSTALASVVLLASLIAGVGCLAMPGIGNSLDVEPDFKQIPSQIDKWRGTDADFEGEVFQRVKDTLTFNSARIINYETPVGDRASAWFIYWKSAMVVKDYHSPDVCHSKHGQTIVDSATIVITTPKGRTIPLTYRQVEYKVPVPYMEDGVRKYRFMEEHSMIAYWTQEGRRIWDDEDEARCASFMFPFYWARDRIDRERGPDVIDDRLVVNIAMTLYKYRSYEQQKATLTTLAGKLADELYEVCPWADPKPQ